MVWRGRNSSKDRFFAALVYVLPLIEVLGFGTFFFHELPFLRPIFFIPLSPFLAVYSILAGSIPFFRLILFFVLLLTVVRNDRILHFIRFNTMQAILLMILTRLCQAILELLGIWEQLTRLSSPLIWNALITTIFIAVTGAAIYAIVQSIRGLYAEIPLISEAAYSQVR